MGSPDSLHLLRVFVSSPSGAPEKDIEISITVVTFVGMPGVADGQVSWP
jgi:hypothetical protein